jgi:tRNA threonylcarbamoyladenosine biosynthesis protein TsaE
MKKKLLSSSESETMDFASQFASTIKPGDVICLKGDLGAGKTHFVKGFAGAFGVPPDQVSSPTFTIIQEYHGTIPVYHFDFYRLKSPKEALEIGAEEYFYSDGVSIVEWPDKIGTLLPSHSIFVSLTHKGGNKRLIEIEDSIKP